MIQSQVSQTELHAGSHSVPEVSIIIVSWNVRDLLRQCLDTLLSGIATGRLTFEIIVVDNASQDGSADLAANYSEVRIIRSAINLGYARANNAGLKIAKGQHLLILNPDTVPYERSIERLVSFQRAYHQAGIVSPRLLNQDGTIQQSAFRFPTLWMAVLDLFPLPALVPGRIRQRIYNSRLNGRYPELPDGRKPFKIDHPLGACMLLGRDAYKEVGGFDPAIFMYSEEVDLALRYKQAGWECWQVPLAQVIHLGGQSTSQMPDRMYVELWRSRFYLYKKHYHMLPRIILRMLVIIAQVCGVIISLLGRAFGKEREVSVQSKLSRAFKVISLAMRT